MPTGPVALAELLTSVAPNARGALLKKAPGGTSGPKHRSLRVLSHTHWDREWYLTLEQYRVRLVEVMDKALDGLALGGEFRHFHADSQTILIADYLAVRPDRERQLRAAIQGGTISAGPFFVLNDEFLCSGEAWVENLLCGAEDCVRLGAKRSRVCYVVDNFGHISQLPQIAAQFGLKYFYGIRGWPFQETRHSEFTLEGPDGSRLLALRHPWGYGLVRALTGSTGEIREKIEAALVKLKGQSHADSPLLLMNGIDHAAPPENFDQILAAVREFDPGARQVSLDEYFEELEEFLPSDLDVKRGESRFVPGLYDVLASRMPQKLLYERARQWLEDRLDPLLACARALGGAESADHRKFLWRKFLENLPHDSICGCSIDAVHWDIQRRLEGCIEGVETLFLRTFDRLVVGTETPDGEPSSRLLVFNPLPYRRSAVIEAALDFPEDHKVFHWVLRNEKDEEIPYQLLGTEQFVKRLPSELDVPPRRAMLRARIAVPVDLPAMGVATLRVRHKAGRDGLFSAIYGTESHDAVHTVQRGRNLSPAHGVLENSLIRAELEPLGTWTIVHKETGTVLSRQNLFEHAPDLGDLYKRGQTPADPRTLSDGALRRVTLERNGPLLATYAVEFALQVPAGVREDHSGLRDEEVTLKIVSRATLRKDSPFLELETTLFNTAKDHEVRVLFAGPSSDMKVVSDSIFDVIERPAARESHVLRHPYLQSYENSRSHQKEFVDLSAETFGFSIFCGGLQEHQILPGQTDVVALTLLRAVGWIYRESMGETRTPEAQCQGEMTARYAIYPHAGNWREAGVKRIAREFGCGTFSRHLYGPAPERAPLENGLVTVSDNLCHSTWKPAHADGKDCILRVFNPTPETVRGTVGFPAHLPAWVRRSRLDETEGFGEMSPQSEITVEVPPYEIVTLKVAWD